MVKRPNPPEAVLSEFSSKDAVVIVMLAMVKINGTYMSMIHHPGRSIS